MTDGPAAEIPEYLASPEVREMTTKGTQVVKALKISGDADAKQSRKKNGGPAQRST